MQQGYIARMSLRGRYFAVYTGGRDDISVPKREVCVVQRKSLLYDEEKITNRLFVHRM